MYGIIEYDQDGNPICEICKKSFKRVLSHVRQIHEMNERDYKKEYGFDLKKGICSKESAEKSRLKALENYDTVIAQNLIKGGEKSRFVDGDKGRTKDQVSEQTRIMLRKRLKTPKMQAILKESGKKLGNSGLGNKARWNKVKKTKPKK